MRKSLVIMICLSIGVLIASCGGNKSGREPNTANSGEKTDKQNQSSSTSPALADPGKGGVDSNTGAAIGGHSSEVISPEDPNLEVNVGDTLRLASVKLNDDETQCTIAFENTDTKKKKNVTFNVAKKNIFDLNRDDGKVFARVMDVDGGIPLVGFVFTSERERACYLCLTAGESTRANNILDDPLVRIEFFPGGNSSTLLLGTSGIRSWSCVKSIKIEAGEAGSKYKFKGTVTTIPYY